MTHYVYSTLTNDNLYTFYVPSANDLPNIEKQILIKGGANMANKHIITNYGVVTEVSDNDLDLLNTHVEFILHKKNGFIKIQKKKVEVEVAIVDMQSRDKSSPLVPQDFNENDKALPSDY